MESPRSFADSESDRVEEFVEEESPLELRACPNCSRKFNPTSLYKHIAICEKLFTKKRRVFDSFRQRREGTDLAAYAPPRGYGLAPVQNKYTERAESLGRSRSRNASPVIRTRVTEELARNGTRGSMRASSTTKSQQPSAQTRANSNVRAAHSAENTSVAANTRFSRDRRRSSERVRAAPATEKCPYCTRSFCVKSYDRHVEFCKGKAMQNAIKLSGSSSMEANPAMERLMARTNYRAPSVKNAEDKLEMIAENQSISDKSNAACAKSKHSNDNIATAEVAHEEDDDFEDHEEVTKNAKTSKDTRTAKDNKISSKPTAQNSNNAEDQKAKGSQSEVALKTNKSAQNSLATKAKTSKSEDVIKQRNAKNAETVKAPSLKNTETVNTPNTSKPTETTKPKNKKEMPAAKTKISKREETPKPNNVKTMERNKTKQDKNEEVFQPKSSTSLDELSHADCRSEEVLETSSIQEAEKTKTRQNKSDEVPTSKTGKNFNTNALKADHDAPQQKTKNDKKPLLTKPPMKERPEVKSKVVKVEPPEAEKKAKRVKVSRNHVVVDMASMRIDGTESVILEPKVLTKKQEAAENESVGKMFDDNRSISTNCTERTKGTKDNLFVESEKFQETRETHEVEEFHTRVAAGNVKSMPKKEAQSLVTNKRPMRNAAKEKIQDMQADTSITPTAKRKTAKDMRNNEKALQEVDKVEDVEPTDSARTHILPHGSSLKQMSKPTRAVRDLLLQAAQSDKGVTSSCKQLMRDLGEKHNGSMSTICPQSMDVETARLQNETKATGNETDTLEIDASEWENEAEVDEKTVECDEIERNKEIANQRGIDEANNRMKTVYTRTDVEDMNAKIVTKANNGMEVLETTINETVDTIQTEASCSMALMEEKPKSKKSKNTSSTAKVTRAKRKKNKPNENMPSSIEESGAHLPSAVEVKETAAMAAKIENVEEAATFLPKLKSNTDDMEMKVLHAPKSFHKNKLRSQAGSDYKSKTHKRSSSKDAQENKKREIFISIETEQNEQGQSPISPDTLRSLVGDNQKAHIEEVHANDNKFSKIVMDDEEDEQQHYVQNNNNNIQRQNAKNRQRAKTSLATLLYDAESAPNKQEQLQDQPDDHIEKVEVDELLSDVGNGKGVADSGYSASTPGGTADASHDVDSDELSSLESYAVSSRHNVTSKLSADSAYGSFSAKPHDSLSRQKSTELCAPTPPHRHVSLQVARRPSTSSCATNTTPRVYGLYEISPQSSPLGASGRMDSSNSSSEHSLPPIAGAPRKIGSSTDASESHSNTGLLQHNGNNNGSQHQMYSKDMKTYFIGHINSSTSNISNVSSASGSSTLSASMKMSKFCHECGNKFLVEKAKFCMECGVRRIVL